jgi:methylphosphotriester-DNA--protein-cysteine methyltransferase
MREGMKTYKLIGSDRNSYESSTPGTIGGHRKGKIYGRLDCPASLSAIAKGGYVTQRVFFADEETAIKAGFRPCGVCMPGEYAVWKRQTESDV